VGEDAIKVARMFPGKVELRRPMSEGVLNKGEDKKMIVMAELINMLVGKAPTEDSVVCICISSDPIDGSSDNTYHKARLESMYKRNGWNVKVIEEGMAVCLAERPTMIEKDGTEVPYSGISCSFGAGRANCVLSYKGLQVIGASIAISGDWIDRQVSNQTDVAISQVIAKKEKELDFTNINYDDDVIFALDAYYTEMIRKVFSAFGKKFNTVKSEFDAPLDIVIAGGTAMPKGFVNKAEEVIRKLDLPFEIKNIRVSEDPRNSVVKGCLAQAVVTMNKIEKQKGSTPKKDE